MTVIPAYGRDYKSAAAVHEAWAQGHDFIVADMHDKYDGKPVNIEDARGLTVTARYSELRKVVKLQ